MKKRLTMALAAGALVAALVPGVAAAAPDPDSAAGRCGGFNTTTNGIGDSTGWNVPNLKAVGATWELSLGETIQLLAPDGFGTPDYCANG
jgi:hypothetical protein